MKRFFLFVILVFVAALAGAVLLFSAFHFVTRGDAPTAEQRKPEPFTPAEGPVIDAAAVPSLAAMDREFTKVVEAVVPSVVSITTSRRVRGNSLRMDPRGRNFGGGRYYVVPQERTQNSLGSGVIVSKEGHIISNNHVIADMDEIHVRLSDGREFPAEVISTDPATDIAVLKIDAPDLRPLPFADSDEVKVGQLVFAVGNPYGLQETVTQGIISATGRRAMQDSGNEYLQTDTTINPGNSGGPLVSLRGEIVGINNQIFTETGNWQGVGFAIPSNVVRHTLESVLAHGRIVRPWLGVAMQEITPELARQFGLKTKRGALVTEVFADSPAGKAGLKPGDIIVKFAGKPVTDMQALRTRVASADVGSEVKIEVLRAGEETELTASISEQPARTSLASNRTTPQRSRQNPAASTGALAGVTVADIPPGYRSRLPENVSGVIVTGIDPRSQASEALQVGDVIEEINRQPVSSAEEYERLAGQLDPEERHMLFIARGQQRAFVVVDPA